MASLRRDRVQLEARNGGTGRLVRETQLGLYLVCEAGWLFACSAALGGWLGAGGGALISLPNIIAALVAAAFATRVTLRYCRSIGLARASLTLLGILAAVWMAAAALWQADGVSDWNGARLLLSLNSREPRAVGAMALALLAWWRGIAAGRTRLYLD